MGENGYPDQRYKERCATLFGRGRGRGRGQGQGQGQGQTGQAGQLFVSGTEKLAGSSQREGVEGGREIENQAGTNGGVEVVVGGRGGCGVYDAPMEWGGMGGMER